MTYFRLIWKHRYPDEPVEIWSELDDALWESRKVEIWADGRKGYADQAGECGGTFLGLEPLNDLEAWATGPEFELEYVAPVEFERVWRARSG